jgi:hypothetical protein
VGTCAAPLRNEFKKTILIGSIVYGSDHPLLQVNDDVFVANGFEKIWASFGHRLK